MSSSFPALNEEGRDEKGYTELHWHVFASNFEAVKEYIGERREEGVCV
jgi:ankyrin repeat protein